VDEMSKTRADRLRAPQEWADRVDKADLKLADTEALWSITELVEQRYDLEDELANAVHSARRAHRSCLEIGVMLGVSKQTAQRK